MTATYQPAFDRRDVEVTLARPLVNALMARIEIADAAAETLEEMFAEIAEILPTWMGPDRMRDLLSTVVRPLSAFGTNDSAEVDHTCPTCSGGGKLDDLRSCWSCHGSGFADGVAVLQIIT